MFVFISHLTVPEADRPELERHITGADATAPDAVGAVHLLRARAERP